MPTFRVYATYETVLFTEIEADDEQSAFEKAKDIDGGDFTECSLGDWHVSPDVELI
jgi:hypothetical protein